MIVLFIGGLLAKLGPPTDGLGWQSAVTFGLLAVVAYGFLETVKRYGLIGGGLMLLASSVGIAFIAAIVSDLFL